MVLMKFQDFCNKMATKESFGEQHPFAVIVPDRYKVAVNAMIENLRSRRNAFNIIDTPPYIVKVFDKDYITILDEKLEGGDIPTGIIYGLSQGIYGLDPIDLNESQQAIIKVLTTYICIQN